MFIGAHQRLLIPAVLGEVIKFDNVQDAGIRVPAAIVLENDSDVQVVVRFDANLDKAEILSTVSGAGNFNIVGGANDALKISIDEDTAVDITLTAGGARTLAEVATDINAAFVAAVGNAAAAARCVVSGNYLDIMSGTVGAGSSVRFVTVLLNAYATLGFAVGVTLAEDTWSLNIVSPVTVKAKGHSFFMNPRPSAKRLRLRGLAVPAVVIDATLLYRHSGVQQ
jgi:hypothetical protein